MTVIIISALACVGTIAVALVRPQVRVGGYDVCVFFVPALLGALGLTLFGVLPWDDVAGGLAADSDINPLKILALFLSMTLLSVFLDETGFFRYLANLAVQKCGESRQRCEFRQKVGHAPASWHLWRTPIIRYGLSR